MSRLNYQVGISRAYFGLPAKYPGDEFYATVTVKSHSREQAARDAWEKYGRIWLPRMRPHTGNLPRKISLHVNDPVTRTNIGRLTPISVYEEGDELPEKA